MSKMNTLEGKRLRRIERREKSDTEFRQKLHAAYTKKYPMGQEFMSDEGPVWVPTPKRVPAPRLIVSMACVKCQAYLRKHGLPHSEHIAKLAA